MSKIHNLTKSCCLICDDKIDSINSFKIHSTKRQTHSLCQDCLSGYITPIITYMTENIRKRVSFKYYIDCPGSYHGAVRNKCKCIINPSYILKVISNNENLIDTYNNLYRVIYVASSNDLYICKNNECGEVIEKDKYYLQDDFSCPACKTTWCSKCNILPYHTGKSCLEHEVSERTTENGKLIHDLNENGTLKFCPKCKTPTIKNEGCNKISCIECGAHWCWLCRLDNIDYDHFNSEGVNPCANKLWI